MADVVYNSAKKSLLDGDIDMVSDTIKIALVTSGYSPDADNHAFFDDVTNEVSGPGYSAGGETLSGKSVNQDNADNEGVFDATDVIWSGAAFTTHGAVIYKDTGVAATSPLIGYFDFGADKTPATEMFIVQFNAEGVVIIT